MDKMISLMKIVEDTVVDGPGFRISLYAAGCSHHCRGCHNPESWDFTNGSMYPVSEVAERINRSVSDVTFSGGDPFYQASAFAELARQIKGHSSRKTIWCYTGYFFEDLLHTEAYFELLQYIDVLVDGPFEADKRDTGRLFRGSANQRLIDVKESLKKKRTVLYEYDPFPIF